MIPRTNRKDLHDIPKQLRQEIDVVFIDRVTDVLRRALAWS